MTTRQYKSPDSAEVAELTSLIAARPDDLIDPFPHTTETELLADSGARGKEEETSPRVVLQGDEIVGYGALDFSPDLRRAHLIGPVIHPGHRRAGLGRELLASLQSQARTAHQKYIRAAVGAMNRGGAEVRDQPVVALGTGQRALDQQHGADFGAVGEQGPDLWVKKKVAVNRAVKR